MASMMRAYSSTLKKYPLIIQSLQAGALMGSGDVISQVVIEKRTTKNFEISRTVRFMAIGTFVVGPSLKTLYGFLNRQFGASGSSAAMKKMVVDQFLWAPVFISVFISAIGLLQGKSPTEVKNKLKDDYVDIILTNWTFWPAVQFCNFKFVPLHHQVLVSQSFALLWNTYLAWKTNRK